MKKYNRRKRHRTKKRNPFGHIPERGWSEASVIAHNGSESVGTGRFSGEANSMPAPKGTCGSTRAQSELRSENGPIEN